MTSLSAQLLKQLEPAVRPGAVQPASTMKPRGSIESQGFEQLLAMAKQGQVRSGQQVELGFEPTPPLSASQLERLASAADQAEISGAKRAFMFMDGRGFVMDVSSRTLLMELNAGADAAVQSVDAAVFVPEELIAQSSAVKLPGNGLLPPGLLEQLTSTSHTQDRRN